MLPSAEGEAASRKKLPRFNKKIVIIGGCFVVLCLLIVIVFMKLNDSSVAIPVDISQKVKSTIYLPNKLPSNYKIDESSFTLVEGDTVLIFRADNGAGSNLIFSEQAKPKNFNFDDFLSGQLEDAKTLSDAPYPSVWGKSMDGRTTLSIVTDDTWILMVTSAPLGQEDIERIAASTQKN